MLSLRARLIISLMRNRHLLAGKKKKETFDDNTSIAAFREQCERGAARFAKIPEGVVVVPEIIPGGDYISPSADDKIGVNLTEILTEEGGFSTGIGKLLVGGQEVSTESAGLPAGGQIMPADAQDFSVGIGINSDGGEELSDGGGGLPTAGRKYGALPLNAYSRPGIKAEWLVPSGVNPEKLILYVHGGGYVSGSCSDHRGFVSKFAKTTGYTCLVYEYRLAPEHPFPAAINDSVVVYFALLKKGYRPENILIAGESAGGGLTLALLLALKNMEAPLPVAAVAISPWADLTCSGPSYQTKNKVSLAPLNSWHVFSKHYRGASAPNHPLISPVFGDLQGLPPIFINAGTDDELYDDSELFVKKARQAGVDVTFRAGAGMFHCYPLMAPMFREATEAMNEIAVFIKKYLR
jgi:acetyl esterase/lipase